MQPVWILQNLDNGAELAFNAEHLAMHAAEKMVGNRSVADCGDILMYGRGDGTTSVMIRRFTRDEAAMIFPDLSLPIEE